MNFVSYYMIGPLFFVLATIRAFVEGVPFLFRVANSLGAARHFWLASSPIMFAMIEELHQSGIDCQFIFAMTVFVAV
jgi:hypothetical protein